MRHLNPNHDALLQLPIGEHKWVHASYLRYDDETDVYYILHAAPLELNNGRDEIRITRLSADQYRIDLTRSNEARIPVERGAEREDEMIITDVHRTIFGKAIRAFRGAPEPVS